MVEPSIEGQRIYRLLYNDYDFNFGGSVVGISGAQGSVKTTVCLDLAEKKLEHHPNEKIFWRETLKSPMQCERLLFNDYKIYVEKDYNLKFLKPLSNIVVKPDVTFFDDIEQLYDIAECGIINTVFFKSNKSWSHLIDICNLNSATWNTVFLQEMEGLYYAGANNQTSELWWDFMRDSGEIIKECRKSHTSVIGDYHDENLIDHRVKNKFMFFLYGFGAIVNPSRSRVKQSMVDRCKLGEFCIAHGRNRFGKIKINNFYPSVNDCIVAYD